MASTIIVFNTSQPSSTVTYGSITYTATDGSTHKTFENSITTTIPANSFNTGNAQTELITVTIGDIITLIDDHAFDSCQVLSSVIFESSSTLQTIGNYAFQSTPITTITIPNSVTSIGISAFNNIGSNLSSITFQSSSSLQTINNTAFQSCVISTITIPNTVNTIGSGAFNNCPFLSSVIFEATSSLLSIGQTAFQSTAITSIIIPNTVTSMGNNVFNNDTVLNSVTNSSPTITLGSLVFDPSYNSSSNFFYSTSSSNPMYVYVKNNYSDVTLSPPSCFNKGTLILTKNGYVEIENIKVGDEIVIMNENNNEQLLSKKYCIDDNNKQLSSKKYCIENENNEQLLSKKYCIKNKNNKQLLSKKYCVKNNEQLLLKEYCVDDNNDNKQLLLKEYCVGDEKFLSNIKKVKFTYKQPFECSNYHFTNYMCKYKCNNFPNLMVTGGHALIVDELTNEMNDFVKKNDYYDYVLDNKFKLLAGLDCNIVIIM